MSQSSPLKYAAAGVAAVVLAYGAYALGNSSSGQGTAGTASAASGRGFPGGHAAAPNGQAPPSGRMPGNGQMPPGFGTPVTGAAAKKATAAALAKYQGTAERVERLQDGSYVVHVITSDGEYHVRVSKAFKVTGADQGGPGRRDGGRDVPGAPGSGSTT